MAMRMIRIGGAVLVAHCCVLLAFASPAAAETSLEVSTPAGQFVQGASAQVPLLVTVKADGAVEGNLVVSTDRVPVASQQVQVPGGSSKTVVMFVPHAPWSGYSVGFNADDPDDSSTAVLDVRTADGDELVAVFPSVAGRGMPATADLVVEVGRARLFAFDPELLLHGRRVLSVFGQVVASGDDLDRLSEPARDALWEWVTLGGGTLVLAAHSDDIALPANPAIEYTDAGRRSAWFGLGSVVFAGDALNDGFDGLISPLPTGLDESIWVDPYSSLVRLVSDAGVQVIEIAVLMVVLLIYALAGPLLWLRLRRRRREPLMWLLIPALAIATTGIIYGAGRLLRDAASTAHATIVVDTPGGRFTATQVLLTSPHGGSVGLGLDPGWDAAPYGQFPGGRGFGDEFGFGGAATSATVEDNRLMIDLEPGGYGVVTAEATLAAGSVPAFGVSARTEAAGVLTVTNNTPHALSDVVVATGNSAVRLSGRLEPGAGADVRLRPAGEVGWNSDPLIQEVLWGGDFDNGDDFDDGDDGDDFDESDSNPGILGAFLSANRQVRTDGLVTVVGWTRDLASPLRTQSGESVETGSTGLVTVARIDAARSAGSNVVSVLRGWETSSVTDRPTLECSDGALTFRILSVGGFEPDDVAVLAVQSRHVSGLDVWDGDSWVPAGLADLGSDPVIELPGAALTDHSVVARLTPGCGALGRTDFVPVLRPLQSDDLALPLGTTVDLAEETAE